MKPFESHTEKLEYYETLRRRNAPVVDQLSKQYEVTVKHGLDGSVPGLLRAGGYNALITNVAASPYGYMPSLELINYMKAENPGLCIIVYTAAPDAILEIVKTGCGIENIVTKKHSVSQDIMEIEAILKSAFKE